MSEIHWFEFKCDHDQILITRFFLGVSRAFGHISWPSSAVREDLSKLW